MKNARTPLPDGPITWKQRLMALSNLPRFFRLVWQTSPGIMLVNGILRITRSAIPVAILYVGKLIIDQVVLLLRSGQLTAAGVQGGGLSFLWKLVALKF